jgi:predicted metal-dependent hydrolase
MNWHGVVTYGADVIEYEARFTPRSSLEISVHPDGRVEVVAPHGTPREVVEKRLRARAPWIRRQQRFFVQFKPRTTPRQYVNGETHLYLGRQYRLRVSSANADHVKLVAGRLEVASREPMSPTKAAQVLEGWYRSRARVKFHERMERVFPPFERLGHSRPPIRVQRLTYRWGSLGPSRLMLLNTRLIQAPLPCIDYVIVHELCHLEHRDHGRDFYDLLDRLLPDWQTRKSRLERMLA